MDYRHSEWDGFLWVSITTSDEEIMDNRHSIFRMAVAEVNSRQVGARVVPGMDMRHLVPPK
jgi:hypothetical protein